ncbi:unnamed protein product [Peniophora sp. CBMAI 1063]|nr:unnamed protein product [Peniophora sp. CBMAI 1063]
MLERLRKVYAVIDAEQQSDPRWQLDEEAFRKGMELEADYLARLSGWMTIHYAVNLDGPIRQLYQTIVAVHRGQAHYETARPPPENLNERGSGAKPTQVDDTLALMVLQDSNLLLTRLPDWWTHGLSSKPTTDSPVAALNFDKSHNREIGQDANLSHAWSKRGADIRRALANE